MSNCASGFQHVGDIVHLNVGGTKFSTSKQTLTWVPDSFFTALLSGRIPSLKDETGAYFIDRDPRHFGTVLNYLRTRDLELRDTRDIRALRQEAEYYGVAPLVRRLVLCEDMTQSSCGDVLFYGLLTPPFVPLHEPNPPSNSPTGPVQEQPHQFPVRHLRNSSLDLRVPSGSNQNPSAQTQPPNPSRTPLATRMSHTRTASLELRHVRTSSADLNKFARNDVGLVLNQHHPNGPWTDPMRVRIIKAHHTWIAVAYAHFVVCYRLKDSTGWQHVMTSPHIEACIENIAVNANTNKMVAISCGSLVHLWGITDDGTRNNIGSFNLHVRVEHLFFIGSQLVALSLSGKIGVWHAMTQHWQIQDVLPITSFDTAGSFLLLGCNNGSIYYIDMQKFPLRMKDNDLLVTELYRDPSKDPITAISVYLTPKTSICGNWIEIAYGTKSGVVRVIVQHPETVGHGPQLFQTFTVHQNPVTKITLSEKFLISACKLLTGYITHDNERKVSYFTWGRVLDSDVGRLVQHAAVRSLSCEVIPGKEGQLYFGDNERGHVISHSFFVEDVEARGGRRFYSITILMQDKHVLLNSWPFFRKYLPSLIGDIQNRASRVYENEKASISSTTTRKGPRTLPDLTATPDIFSRIHTWFIWLIRTGSERLVEAPAPSFHTKVKVLSINEQLSEIEEIFQCENEEINEDVVVKLRQFFNTLGEEKFTQLLHSLLVGVQVVVRGPQNHTISILNVLRVMLPIRKVRLVEWSDIYLSPHICNLLGVGLHTAVPIASSDVERLDIVGSEKEQTYVSRSASSLLCFRLPQLLSQILASIQNKIFSDRALSSHLTALIEHWTNTATTVRDLKTKRGFVDQRLLQSLDVQDQDLKLLDFWSS